MRQYAVTPISARSSNACAAISPARPLPTSGSSATAQAKSCCSSRAPGATAPPHIVMSPLELMQRLAALVPRPRLHLIRFHGVLAPHAKLRPQIVPSAPVNAHQACDHYAQSAPALAPAPMSWACLLKRVFDIDVEHCHKLWRGRGERA